MSPLILLLTLQGLLQTFQLLPFLPVHFLLDLLLLLLPFQLFLPLLVSLFLPLLVPQLTNPGLCSVLKPHLLGIHLLLDFHNIVFQLSILF